MIRALIVGTLHTDPKQRTTKNGNPYALARVSVAMGEEGRIFCSVICFDPAAVDRLSQLKSGASVAMAGTLKVGTWEAKDGTIKPSLDMVADEVAATTPRPRKPKIGETARLPGGGFDDLPGCDHLGEVDGE